VNHVAVDQAIAPAATAWMTKAITAAATMILVDAL
jgi:hypothetical protein